MRQVRGKEGTEDVPCHSPRKPRMNVGSWKNLQRVYPISTRAFRAESKKEKEDARLNHQETPEPRRGLVRRGAKQTHRPTDERVRGHVDVKLGQRREGRGHPALGVEGLAVEQDRRGDVDLHRDAQGSTFSWQFVGCSMGEDVPGRRGSTRGRADVGRGVSGT